MKQKMATQLPAIGFHAHHEPHDIVDFGLFLRTLRQQARTILLFTGIAAAAALLHVLLAVPQFTASGALYLGETQQGSGSGGGSSNAVNLSAYAQQSDVETQIELLTTGTLIQRAVLETGLNATIHPAGAPALRYWRWKWLDHGSTKAFLPAADALRVVDATLVGKFRLVTGAGNTYKLYKAGGIFGREKPVLSGTIGTVAHTADGALLVRFARPGKSGGSAATLPGAAVPSAALAKISPGRIFDLSVVAPDALANGLAGGQLRVTAGGSPTRPTKLARISLRWSDPFLAQIFVNHLMHDYIATQLQWKAEAASVTETFVTGQLANVARRLARADQELSAYQAKTGIIDPQQAAQAAVEQMSQLEQRRGQQLLQLQALRQLHGAMMGRRSRVNPYLTSETNDPVLTSLTTSLSEAEVKLSQLRAEFTDRAQNVQIQQAQVNQLRASIRELIDNDLASASQSLASIERLIASDRTKLKNQPAESLKVRALTRKSKQLAQLYEVLTQKAEQAQISKAATIIDTRVVTSSRLPLRATSPRAAITVVAGAMVGFFAGLALVFGRRAFSGRYESEEQIRRAVRLPVYGAVPQQVQRLIGANAFGPDNFNPFSEAFQLIKRNIYRNTNGSHASAILLISASKQDGKTTIAANLCRTLAEDGKRVVLLDCDFYLSRLNLLVDFEGLPGLTDWLQTGSRPKLQRWPDGKFWVLPSGGAAPERGARLDEAALRGIIETLGEEFDYIILDSPPLPIVSDGLVLGSVSDLILSVVGVSNTMRRAFDLHNELIETLDKPHGLIINGADAMTYGGEDAYFLGAARRGPKFTGWFRI
ncbi:polysaccharide biosynthesis tyrosine autokinase [Acidiphilium sp. C61]|jgi:uncharacterized protein involved in exopolysaccharide biosynthesis|uniref:GumC family protein n=1 Tax=Acidiphilium sp. C61 TaxID=1671485 RepID=UPI00157B7635|nr:polysaccharide biosynthesis tyrosine autokinase [Acidiphilium sp. C61]